MPIKCLTISGGGAIGLQYIGILKYLNEQKFWEYENIKSIYSTSVGTIIGVLLCLNYDWETLNKYIIERPWQDIFNLSAKQIIESYFNKGLYDKKIIEIMFKPLLEAKDISLSISLIEFFDLTNIFLHIYTFELNSFETFEVNYISHPNLSLITAIAMSSSIPGLFSPIFFENMCFIDGGVMANYPLSFSLKDYKKEEIFGLNYYIINKKNELENQISNDSSILDFLIKFTTNAMNYITNNNINEKIPYEIIINTNESPCALNFTKKTLYSFEKRKEMIEQGYLIGKKFLENLLIKDLNK